MNILFVLYGDFTSNSANPLVLYARELRSRGHECAIAVPSNLESISLHENPAFVPILYRDALASPDSIFSDGRPADVIHACTPREVVRRFVIAYLVKQPTPLVIYLEDNEWWVAIRALGLDKETLFQHSEKEISKRLPDALAHPFSCDSFLGLADAVVVIQDKLGIKVPPWVRCETVMIGVDIELFTPREPDLSLRNKYGVEAHEKVIVYHGGLNEFTRSGIENLCRAIGLINQRGYQCRLLRTGPFALDFLEKLPRDTVPTIKDLGLLPKRELPDILALADVFVQPGGIDVFEDLRLPGKIPEFLAMSRPVVLPNANIAHLFRDGLDGVLLDNGSSDEIATKCIELFNDPQRANSIGRAGRLLAEKHFDVRLQARRLEQVYKTACHEFNPVLSSKTWKDAGPNTPITLLLARKLKLLATSNIKLECTASDILMEFARYIEFAQQRVDGLESFISERHSADKTAPSNRLRHLINKCDRRLLALIRGISGFLPSK